MNQIHSGIREVTVQSDSKDEIGVLIRTFRRMMDEINKLISEVYEAKNCVTKDRDEGIAGADQSPFPVQFTLNYQLEGKSKQMNRRSVR